jgi:hypothetical protein
MQLWEFKNQVPGPFYSFDIFDQSGKKLRSYGNRQHSVAFDWKDVEKYWANLPDGYYQIMVKHSRNEEEQNWPVTKGEIDKIEDAFFPESYNTNKTDAVDRAQIVNEIRHSFTQEMNAALAKQRNEFQEKEIQKEREKLENWANRIGIIIEHLAPQLQKLAMGLMQNQSQPTNQPTSQPRYFEGIFSDQEMQYLDAYFRQNPELKSELFKFFQQQNNNENGKTETS